MKGINQLGNIMKNFTFYTVTLAVGLFFSFQTLADTLSHSQIQLQEQKIVSDYENAKATCNSSVDNAKDICIAEANGIKNIANAELAYKNNPSANTRYKGRVAKANAEYSIALQKCNDIVGNNKDVCIKEAESAKIHQVANAKFRMKTKNANDEAKKDTSEANTTASEKAGDAYYAAKEDKRKADLAVANQKCEAMVGDAKSKCLNDAKLEFAKSL